MCLAPGQGRGVSEGLVTPPQRGVLHAHGVQAPELAILSRSLLLAVLCSQLLAILELPMLAVLGKRHLGHIRVSIVSASSSAAQLEHELHKAEASPVYTLMHGPMTGLSWHTHNIMGDLGFEAHHGSKASAAKLPFVVRRRKHELQKFLQRQGAVPAHTQVCKTNRVRQHSNL